MARCPKQSRRAFIAHYSRTSQVNCLIQCELEISREEYWGIDCLRPTLPYMNTRHAGFRQSLIGDQLNQKSSSRLHHEQNWTRRSRLQTTLIANKNYCFTRKAKQCWNYLAINAQQIREATFSRRNLLQHADMRSYKDSSRDMDIQISTEHLWPNILRESSR